MSERRDLFPELNLSVFSGYRKKTLVFKSPKDMVALREEMVICRVVVIEDITFSVVSVIKPSTGKGDVTASDDGSFVAVFFEDISEGGNAGEETVLC